MAKKQSAITYANLTTALESTSLIGMLMRAQTPDWPSGFVSLVVKCLFDKFEPQDTMSLIDMNCLKQQIGLKTLESNPQMMFEQIAALENQFKTLISDSEKPVIVIQKLPAKMRKEGGMLMASHIENAAFQYGCLVHCSYAKNMVINAVNNQESESGKEVVLAAFNGTCNRCGPRGHKARSISMGKPRCQKEEVARYQTVIKETITITTTTTTTEPRKRSSSREIATIAASWDTRKQIVVRKLCTRKVGMKLVLWLCPMAIMLNSCCVQKWSMEWQQQPNRCFPIHTSY